MADGGGGGADTAICGGTGFGACPCSPSGVPLMIGPVVCGDDTANGVLVKDPLGIGFEVSLGFVDDDTLFRLLDPVVVFRELAELPSPFDLGVIIEALLCSDRVLDFDLRVSGTLLTAEPETVEGDIDATVDSDDLEAELLEGLSTSLG